MRLALWICGICKKVLSIIGTSKKNPANQFRFAGSILRKKGMVLVLIRSCHGFWNAKNKIAFAFFFCIQRSQLTLQHC